MTLYHGSPVGGLSKLKPFLSEHKKSYVYFSTNPVVALLYAVKPVPKPFSFYPYGFDGDGTVVYSEYYKNAFEDIYKDKVGYLYKCENVKGAENPTQINCAYTVTEPIEINTVEEITDCYKKLKEYEKQGLFRIKKFEAVSEKEIQIVYNYLKDSMIKYDLKNNPDNEMSIFIKTNFPHIWEVN